MLYVGLTNNDDEFADYGFVDDDNNEVTISFNYNVCEWWGASDVDGEEIVDTLLWNFVKLIPLCDMPKGPTA